MQLEQTSLPDGRRIYCVNPYEVDFSVHEIFNDDLATHGIDLPPDGVFLDVGANIGLFSLHLLDLCPEARVYAYEPMPEAFAALERNLAGRAQAFALGLGAEPGTASFDYFPGITALSSCHGAVSAEMVRGLRQILAGQPVVATDTGELDEIVARTGARERAAADPAAMDRLFASSRVEARIDTLSRQIHQHGLSRIDLLKIDTEGAEKDVLAGLDPADRACIRQMVVEVHLGKEETERMAAQLQGWGYATSQSPHPLAKQGAPVFHIYAKRIA